MRIRSEILEIKEADEYINSKFQAELNKTCKKLNDSNDEGDIEEIKLLKIWKKIEENIVKELKDVF